METPRRYATDGTWNHVWIVILAEADEAGEIDWTMSVGFPIAGQHFGVMVQAVGHDCGYDVVGEDLILATTTQMRGDQQGSPRLPVHIVRARAGKTDGCIRIKWATCPYLC